MTDEESIRWLLTQAHINPSQTAEGTKQGLVMRISVEENPPKLIAALETPSNAFNLKTKRTNKQEWDEAVEQIHKAWFPKEGETP